jgi:UDP-glucuronate decarboxylase
VSDTLDAFVRLMATDDDFTGPVNIGNPHECTVLELAELVVSLTNSSSEIVCEPLPADDPARRCPDIQLAKAMLGWEPKVPLREGLKATIDYFERQLTAKAASSAAAPTATRRAPAPL